jgi:quinol monooxygenase YgiN
MITVIVQFKLPQPLTRDEARKAFSATAPNYRKLPGLVRKCYLWSEDGKSAGGVYLWRSRADAERRFDDEWMKSARARYGGELSVTYYETPVIVDNDTDKILDEF